MQNGVDIIQELPFEEGVSAGRKVTGLELKRRIRQALSDPLLCDDLGAMADPQLTQWVMSRLETEPDHVRYPELEDIYPERLDYLRGFAKGEKWISVGTKEEWNNDDIHCWSAFCFDGWRYLRFELPSNAPYDCYREYGSTWWGSYFGDGVVDLPLKLEKVIVERRPKVIYGNDLVPAKPDDVLLGDLHAEYASPSDRTEEAIRLSRVRMPIPEGAPELTNPIAEMSRTGVGAPTKVQRVTDPDHWYDGTRCHVHFEPVAGAKGYDVWVSPYADGRGAMQLGSGWTESGQLIQGLRPDMPFYLFVVYTDKDDKMSKPSKPLEFVLKDKFGYK